jgi:hypothetical protein
VTADILALDEGGRSASPRWSPRGAPPLAEREHRVIHATADVWKVQQITDATDIAILEGLAEGGHLLRLLRCDLFGAAGGPHHRSTASGEDTARATGGAG